MIVQPVAAIPCAMIIIGIIGAHWLGNKKIPILDFIAALLVLFLLIYVGFLVFQVLR